VYIDLFICMYIQVRRCVYVHTHMAGTGAGMLAMAAVMMT